NAPGQGFGGQVHFLDVARLRPTEVGWTTQRPNLDAGMNLRASADGKVFTLWGAQGLHHALVLVGNAVRAQHHYTSGYYAVAGPAGMVVSASLGMITNELKVLRDTARDPRRYFPAQDETYYLSIQPDGSTISVAVYLAGEARPFATLPDFELAAAGATPAPA